MILLYVAASALVGIVIGAAAGRFAWIAGFLVCLLGLGPIVILYAYDRFIGIAGDPSAYSMGATMAFVLVMPCGIAALATALLRRD